MRALAVKPGVAGVFEVQVTEPRIERPDEVKLRVLEVGICGTDREVAAGGRAAAPDGEEFLIIGHEVLGRVVEVGSSVRSVKPGDLAVVTVRRGCGACIPCTMGRCDMCRTGEYRERGIWKLHGFQAEYVVDEERYVVGLSPRLREIGVLCEPMSVVQKAFEEGVRVQQARLPDGAMSPAWIHGKKCLVAGLGPVGLLAALSLELRGAYVTGIDIVPPGSPRARCVTCIGGEYIDGSNVRPEDVGDAASGVDLVFESAGIPELAFDLLGTLAPGGISLVMGIPSGSGTGSIPASALIRRLVLNNQLMVGSVNAAAGHFRMAAADLEAFLGRWSGPPSCLITHRYRVEAFASTFMTHPREEIKAVVVWADD